MEGYASHSLTGWWYGVVPMTIQAGAITDLMPLIGTVLDLMETALADLAGIRDAAIGTEREKLAQKYLEIVIQTIKVRIAQP